MTDPFTIMQPKLPLVMIAPKDQDYEPKYWGWYNTVAATDLIVQNTLYIRGGRKTPVFRRSVATLLTCDSGLLFVSATDPSGNFTVLSDLTDAVMVRLEEGFAVKIAANTWYNLAAPLDTYLYETYTPCPDVITEAKPDWQAVAKAQAEAVAT